MCAPYVIRQAWGRPAAPEPYMAPDEAASGTASDAERRYGQASLTVSFRHVVDLTHPLSPSFPVFPAFQPMQVRVNRTMERDGFYARTWEVGEHTGTHLDAPAHFAAGEHIRPLDQIPVTQLVVPLAVIDIQERVERDHDALLTVDDVLAYERRHGRIPDGAAVCVYTGWETRADSAQRFLNQTPRASCTSRASAPKRLASWRRSATWRASASTRSASTSDRPRTSAPTLKC